VIFYGSQTGTAEDYANRLAREGKQYGFESMVADPEEHDMVRKKKSCLIRWPTPFCNKYNDNFKNVELLERAG